MDQGVLAAETRPQFVWFLVIWFGLTICLQLLFPFMVTTQLVIVGEDAFAFIKALDLFDHAISLIITLLFLCGSLALFNFKSIALKFFLSGFICLLVDSIWDHSTKSIPSSYKTIPFLLGEAVNACFFAYVVYYSYSLRRRGFFNRPTHNKTIALPTTESSVRNSPDLPIAPDWLLNNIAEASKKASRIYTMFLSLLAYCAVTVISTTDRQIVFDEPARLPLVDLGIPLVGFFIVSPLLCLLVFIYLQLYLHRIKGLIAQLRTRYASISHGQLYPWMLTIAEDPESGYIGRLQKGIVTASLWWTMPVVLFLFPIWFIKKHDPILTYVVGCMTFPRFHRHLYKEEFDEIGGQHEHQDQTAVYGRV